MSDFFTKDFLSSSDFILLLPIIVRYGNYIEINSICKKLVRKEAAGPHMPHVDGGKGWTKGAK